MAAEQSYIVDGQQVEASDLNSFGTAAAVGTGAALSAIVGVADANVDDAPLTVVPVGGLAVTVGGLGQKVLVQSRLADYLPAQTFVLAAASSAARYDLIAFAYADVIVPSGLTANIMDTQGNIAPAQPTSYVYRGIQLTVVTGTPGAARPGAPSGFDPLAQVQVPAGATALSVADITLLLPTIAARLIALTGGGVSGVNGKTGAVVINSGSGIAIDNSGSAVVIDNTGVLSVNGQTGNVSISAGGGGGIGSITSHDGSIGVVNSGSAVDLSARPNGITLASQCGISNFSLAVNYGTAQTGPLTFIYGTDSCVLGSVQLPIMGSGNSNGAAEAHFRLLVKSGAGAQHIAGAVPLPNTGVVTATVFLDGVQIGTSANTVLNWSATILDDGNMHTLVLHSHTNVAPVVTAWAAWVPANSSGGIDATRFSYVGA